MAAQASPALPLRANSPLLPMRCRVRECLDEQSIASLGFADAPRGGSFPPPAVDRRARGGGPDAMVAGATRARVLRRSRSRSGAPSSGRRRSIRPLLPLDRRTNPHPMIILDPIVVSSAEWDATVPGRSTSSYRAKVKRLDSVCRCGLVRPQPRRRVGRIPNVRSHSYDSIRPGQPDRPRHRQEGVSLAYRNIDRIAPAFTTPGRIETAAGACSMRRSGLETIHPPRTEKSCRCSCRRSTPLAGTGRIGPEHSGVASGNQTEMRHDK